MDNALEINHLGKQFGREWIFKDLSYSLPMPSALALTGNNGSGKSTLLKILAGANVATEGKISYCIRNQVITDEQIFRHISYAAPYLQLPEELTLSEVIDFQARFKKFNCSKTEIIEKLELKATHKPIKYFSSGMKQKLKLGLALFAQSDFLLLDEPTANLDAYNTEWYQRQILDCLKDSVIIVASNEPHEYEFCQKVLKMQDYKP